jgi:kynurenine formamidase
MGPILWLERSMRLVDLTHTSSRRSAGEDLVPVVVRSADAIHLVPLDRLVTLATVIDLTRRADAAEISRADLSRMGVAGIAGCILRTDWCDRHLEGFRAEAPRVSIEAAAYLLEGGVRTVAGDFPITSDAADLLLHNNCVLIHCLSGVAGLTSEIVRLVALPLKLEDTFSAEARVIAMEED